MTKPNPFKDHMDELRRQGTDGGGDDGRGDGVVQFPAQPKRRGRFVRVPWAWWAILRQTKRTATWNVAMYLLHEFWRNGSQRVRLANKALENRGVGRRAKWKALKDLEALGLVSVERHPGKSLLVIWIVDPHG